MEKTIWDKQINLESQGIYGHIWPITDRDEVIEALVSENRVIQGGDILKTKNGKYIHEGSNWYYNGSSCEESAKKAREYFDSWSPADDLAVVFVFVPNIE